MLWEAALQTKYGRYALKNILSSPNFLAPQTLWAGHNKRHKEVQPNHGGVQAHTQDLLLHDYYEHST